MGVRLVPARGEEPPDVALLGELQSGGAHEASGEQDAEFPPMGAATGGGEMTEGVAAVGVEEGVGDRHGLVPAERVRLRPVDGLGDTADAVVVGDGSEEGVDLGEPVAGQEPQPPRRALADEPEGDDRAVVFRSGELGGEPRDGEVLSGLPVREGQVELAPSAYRRYAWWLGVGFGIEIHDALLV